MAMHCNIANKMLVLPTIVFRIIYWKKIRKKCIATSNRAENNGRKKINVFVTGRCRICIPSSPEVPLQQQLQYLQTFMEK